MDNGQQTEILDLIDEIIEQVDDAEWTVNHTFPWTKDSLDQLKAKINELD